MFGMSFTELLIIAVLALILLGPDKLPDAARTAGKLLRELRRATEDIKDQLETEMYADELKRRPTTISPVPAAPAKPGEPTPAAKEEPPAGAVPAPYAGIYNFPEPPAPAPSAEPAAAPTPPEEPGEARKA